MSDKEKRQNEAQDEGLDIAVFETLVGPTELKPQYEEFCRYMVLTRGNMSKSQRLAGFAASSGCKQAKNMLERADVRERYRELQAAFDLAKDIDFLEAYKATSSASALNRQDVMASQNLSDYIKNDGTLDIVRMAEDGVIIKKYKYRKTVTGEGENQKVDIYAEVELPDQFNANKEILKLTGAVEDKPTEVHVIISPEEDFSKAGTKDGNSIY